MTTLGHIKSIALTIGDFFQKIKHSIIIVSPERQTASKTATKMKNIIDICTQKHDYNWQFKFMSKLYQKLLPDFEKLKLIQYSKLPLTPNNTQWIQCKANCSDKNFAEIHSKLKLLCKAPIFASYPKKIAKRKEYQIVSSTTKTIMLPLKHKQTDKSEKNKQVRCENFAMYDNHVKESIAHKIQNHINHNECFLPNVLGKNTVTAYQGSDRAIDSFICSVAANTTTKAASSKNSVPTIVVAGNCDDGPHSMRRIQHATQLGSEEVNQLFMWPAMVGVEKYFVEDNRLISRYACVSIVTLDTKAQLDLDTNDKQNITTKYTIDEPNLPELENEFYRYHINEVTQADWKQSLSLLHFYVFGLLRKS